ncbi:MAG: cation transporter dimerization domain-containing protein [Melioribacteraceae bacterium]|nr:cation transporter dimerization domain-containing protein [Melioribacteraceae bacterium]
MRESIGGLMNETDPETLEKIVNKFLQMRKNYWIDLHHLRFWKSAEKVFIDFHLTIPYFFEIKSSHVEEEKIVNELNKVFPEAQVRIHFDYCYPNYVNTVATNLAQLEKRINQNRLSGVPIN